MRTAVSSSAEAAAGRFILEVRGLYPEMPTVCEAHEGGKVVTSAKGAADEPCATLLGLDADEITPVVASPQCVVLEPSALPPPTSSRRFAATPPVGDHVHTVVHQHEVVARMWDRFAHAVVSSPPGSTTLDCGVLRQRLNDTLIARNLEALTPSGADPEQRATTRASLERQAAETDGRFQTDSLADGTSPEVGREDHPSTDGEGLSRGEARGSSGPPRDPTRDRRRAGRSSGRR